MREKEEKRRKNDWRGIVCRHRNIFVGDKKKTHIAGQRMQPLRGGRTICRGWGGRVDGVGTEKMKAKLF